MGALTPGNVQHAADAGIPPDWGREVIRLAAAGVIGASVTPLLLRLAERLPITADTRWRHLGLQALALALLAPALVLVSTVAAAWVLDGRAAPAPSDMATQLRADALLLWVCLALLMAAIQLAPRRHRAASAPAEWPDRLAISEGGRLVMVELGSIDWIETQGNYQALHAGAAVHMLRSTSKDLAARLNPARFVRIHRRFIVAIDRVRTIEPLTNGDAIVTLVDGAELRQSRQYRDALRRRLAS